jgi:hypothetical protein
MGIVVIVAVVLIPLLLVGVVIYAARRLFGRGAGGGDGRGVRHFFQYLLLYGLMIVAAIGLSGLLARLLEGSALVREDGPALARALTFTLIGGPLYALVGVWSRRQLREDREEARSLGWGIYSALAPLTALVVTMFALYDVLAWAVRAERYDAGALARLIVWGALWVGHWLIGRRFSTRQQSQIHLALGSVLGLGTASSGLIWLLAVAVETLLGDEAGLVVGSTNDLGRATATLITGASVWVVYWWATFARSERTPLWFGYVLPIGVGGGLITAISAGATVLYDLLVWFLGRPTSVDASRHFSDTPTLAATVVVGGLVWWYHREVLDEAEAADRSEARRVYEYLMAAVGLLAAAGGIATVLVAVIEALTGSGGIEVGTSAINTLLAAVTLLVVGAPLWWIFWQRIQRADGAERAEEVTSPTRRVYLFLLFGLGGVAAVIALLVGVFIAIEDMLEGRFGSETLRSMRFALGLLATTGAIAAYHWAVYRQDRELVPDQERVGPRHVLLIGDADDEIVRTLARATGARVELWPRTDGVAGPWPLEELVATLGVSQLTEVAVISGSDGLHFVGIERD